MRNKSVILIFILFFVFNQKAAEVSDNQIKTIQTFIDALYDLDQTDSSDLVLFDLDETLIESTNIIAKPQFTSVRRSLRSSYEDEFNKYLQSLNPQDAQETELKLQKIINQKNIIEPIIIKKIHELQSRGVKVIGLTARFSNEQTYKSLLELGIDFQINSFVDTELENPFYKDEIFLLNKGIIFTNAINKGFAVFSFLKHTKFLPSKIIFFDNVLNNILDVKEAIDFFNKKYNIQFLGFYYDHLNFQISYDKKKLKSQYKKFVTTGQWIPDKK